MNHKRHRPKHQRAGCLWCKPHKDERAADVGAIASKRETRSAVDEAFAATPTPDGRPCSVCGTWCFIGANCPGCIAETCSDPSCPECGGVRAEHIELDGPLTAPLALLVRVA